MLCKKTATARISHFEVALRKIQEKVILFYREHTLAIVEIGFYFNFLYKLLTASINTLSTPTNSSIEHSTKAAASIRNFKSSPSSVVMKFKDSELLFSVSVPGKEKDVITYFFGTFHSLKFSKNNMEINNFA